MIDEKKKEAIRKEAKTLLENFAKKLEKVKLKENKVKGGVGGFRAEGKGFKGSEDFRKRMFDNSPNKDDECIIAEKKTW